MGKRFLFLCSFSFTEDFSFEVTVDDLLETTHYFKIKKPKVCLELGLGDRIRRLKIGF